MGVTSAAAGRLRLRVVVAGEVVPVWIVRLLDDVASCAALELVDVIIAMPPKSGVEALEMPPPMQALLARCDSRAFGRRIGLLTPEDLHRWAGARGVELTAESALRVARAPADAVPAACLDITLDLTGRGESTTTVADGGGDVWALRGVPTRVGRVHSDLPGLTTVIVRGARVASFEIIERRPACAEWRILDAGVCPTHPISSVVTGQYLAASARQLIFERLKATAAAGPAQVDQRRADDRDWMVAGRHPTPGDAAQPVAEARRSGPSSGIGPLAAFVVRTAARLAREAVVEKQWHLLVGEQPRDRVVPDPSSLRPLVPEAGCYWADPFTMVHEGTTYVFFEEFAYDVRRGRISVIALDRQGRAGCKSVAIELDTHLSYPCIFTHGGRLYMVPESADTGTVDLYECVEMPAQWVYRRTLLSGVQLVDASLVEWGGMWWMFASLKKPDGLRTAELLVLYMSDDPVEGEWRRHPLSPLFADVTNARPAGSPFAVGGKLYRQAQDGSGGYGWGISLNEVVSLTPEDYADRRVATVRPDWAKGLCGTHTVNRAGNIVVMDACRYVLRDPRRPAAESMSV